MAYLRKSQRRLTIPGYAPCDLSLQGNDTILIQLSDRSELLVTRVQAEALYEILDTRGYITAEDSNRPPSEALWIFAVLALTGPFEFCPSPRLFILNRQAKLKSKDINRVFGVGPLGGIRYLGKANEPQLVVALTRLDHRANPYNDALSDGVLTYTGQGLYGNQLLTAGNLALANSAVAKAPVFVLQWVDSSWRFLGRAEVIETEKDTAPGHDGIPRFVYTFRLKLIPQSILAVEKAPTQAPPTLSVIRTGIGTFRPRARLVHTLLGRELISNELVALLELVKNSYDADATRVTITINADHDLIEVADDGHGMPIDVVLTSWLEPSTTSKVRITRSLIKGRRVLGNKGVGRFAASRLGNRLEMFTLANPQAYPQAPREEVHVDVDWSLFSDPSAYLDQVPFRWEAVEPAEKRGPGTTLRIHELASDIAWSRDRLSDLRILLSRMITPFATVNDFTIELKTPFLEYNGPVAALPMLGHPHYTIKGAVKPEGTCTATYISQTGDSWSGPLSVSDVPLACGGFEFEFRVWNREDDDLDRLAKLFESTVFKIRRELDRASGVSVYRDGFRILPYGEAKNDWLRLDARRVQNPTLRLSNNQIVGAVFIGADDNPLLLDQTNREGLIENNAFSDLRDAIIGVISALEQRRYKERPRHRQERVPEPEVSLRDVRETLAQKYPDDIQILNLLDVKSAQITQHEQTMVQTVVRYRRLATLGRLIDMILHDGRHPLAHITGQAEIAQFRMVAMPVECRDEQLLSTLKVIGEQAGQLDYLFTKLLPLGGREKTQAKTCEVEQVIKDTLQLFSSTIRKGKVRVSEPDTHTLVSIDPRELQEVVMNLVDNSLFWLGTIPEESRVLRLQVFPGVPTVRVLVSDSGPGIAPEHREFVFDAYYTTKKDATGKDGSGLGLFIAAEILRENDGLIELVEYDDLPGASFQFYLKAGQEI
jgi:signal transduction histidine kinase